MKYTKELIDEVKELYPKSEEMNRLAEQGYHVLGRYLDDSSTNSISLTKILEAENLAELQSDALRLKRKRDLYYKWAEEYQLFLK